MYHITLLPLPQLIKLGISALAKRDIILARPVTYEWTSMRTLPKRGPGDSHKSELKTHRKQKQKPRLEEKQKPRNTESSAW